VAWVCLTTALLYFAGLLLWLHYRDPAKPSRLMMALLAPPSYLLLLAVALSPLHLLMPAHRSLIRCATLLCTGAVVVLASIFAYRLWLHQPAEDLQTRKFQQLCQGKFPPNAPGMLFVARSINREGSNDIPHYLFAAKLWGFGRTVEDEAAAHCLFQEFSPGFKQLDYLVFYGMDYPNWVSTNQYRLEVRDDTNRLFAFRSTEAN